MTFLATLEIFSKNLVKGKDYVKEEKKFKTCLSIHLLLHLLAPTAALPGDTTGRVGCISGTPIPSKKWVQMFLRKRSNKACHLRRKDDVGVAAGVAVDVADVGMGNHQ